MHNKAMSEAMSAVHAQQRKQPSGMFSLTFSVAPNFKKRIFFVLIFCWAFFATFKKTGGLLMEKQQLLFTAPRVVVYSKELELTGAQIQWESPETGWPKHDMKSLERVGQFIWKNHGSSYEFYWKTHGFLFVGSKKNLQKSLRPTNGSTPQPHFWIPKLPPRVQLKGD